MTFLAHAAGADREGPRLWWERPWFVALLVAAAAIPLLYPPVPPLVDLFGHMGRYRVQLDLDRSAALQQFYQFSWAAIGNLGVDVLVEGLGRWLGLEPAVKLIVIAIPPMTVFGLLWVAREVHHRLPPTAIFALPFAYGFPFLFGFVNFTLSMALALLAFGLWLHLGGRDRDRLRALLFVPIAILIFFTHAFGWGTLGLLCFSAEVVRQHDRGERWFAALPKAAGHALVMTPPILFMLLWRSGTAGQMTFGWFDWPLKWEWVRSALRDRWEMFDIASVSLLGLVLLFALVHRRLEYSRNLIFSTLVLLAAFLVLPWTIFGSAYADMRLVPYLFALALLAIRFKGRTDARLGQALALAALFVFAARLAATTASLAIAADDQQRKLAALDRVPVGARLVHLSGQRCRGTWPLPRNSHLGGMAIVRRLAFSNDQWAVDGANLLTVSFKEAGHFSADPSQMVRDAVCASGLVWPVDRALRAIPPGVFEYAWLIDLPAPDPRLTPGWVLMWSGDGSLLYRLPGSRGKP